MAIRGATRVLAMAALLGGLLASGGAPAAASAPPHNAVGGFAVPVVAPPTDAGFALVFADGSVRPTSLGDAYSLRLADRVTGAAAVPTGGGYWEVVADGNVFGYGTAGAFGSLGGYPLNQPVFAIAPTPSGRGYLLVARDGGVFAFGDAVFRGSAAGLRLNQPMVGITTNPLGRGYRLVARDGGVFAYGKVGYWGSLPARRVHATDVVGIASTPTDKGYWIARSDGRVYAFGDAQPFGGRRPPSACDRFTGIISNPNAQGYRLVTDSGRTFAFGEAPGGGGEPTGTPRKCGHVTARLELPATTIVAGAQMTGYLVVDNQTGAPLRLRVAGGCGSSWVVSLGNDTIPNRPVNPQTCSMRPLTFPAGETQRRFTIRASYATSVDPCRCLPPLPPGDYTATLLAFGPFPPVAPVAVQVVAPA